eukprot:scaffold358_cov256-Pinguiococcus_pyrenoidosus.AAC.31
MAVLNVSDELARTAVGLFDYLNAGAPSHRFRKYAFSSWGLWKISVRIGPQSKIKKNDRTRASVDDRPKEPKFSSQDAITALLETRLVGDLEQARFAIDRLLQLGVIEESKGTTKRRKAADSQGANCPSTFCCEQTASDALIFSSQAAEEPQTTLRGVSRTMW